MRCTQTVTEARSLYLNGATATVEQRKWAGQNAQAAPVHLERNFTPWPGGLALSHYLH